MFEYPPRVWSLTEALVSAAVPFLIVLATGLWLWRQKRRPHVADPTLWCLAAVPAYMMARGGAAYFLQAPHQSDRQIADSICWFFWLALLLGIVASFVKLKVQRGRIVLAWVLSIPAMYVALAALTFEGYSTPMEAAWRSMCKNNLKQIGLAIHNYHETHGSFPPSRLGDPPVSWRVRLLPFLDEEGPYARYDQAAAWDAAPNVKLQGEHVDNYLCPTDQRWRKPLATQGVQYTAYAVPVGPGAMFDPVQSRTFKDLVDGTSSTLMLLEVCGTDIVWTEPRDVNIDEIPLGINLPGNQPGRSDGLLSSQHFGMAQVGLADGSVKALMKETDPVLLRQLLQRDDGQPVGDF